MGRQNLAPEYFMVIINREMQVVHSASRLLTCETMSTTSSNRVNAPGLTGSLPENAYRELMGGGSRRSLTSDEWLPGRRIAGPIDALYWPINAFKRRWHRERRRRSVGRAYDMALEIARAIPRGSRVLDVGCGNGFIAHHLSALLGTEVVGIDLGERTSAPINYKRYDGISFPVPAHSFDAVLLCYVLHHAQNVGVILSELRRALRDGGLVVVYEDIPSSFFDRAVCWSHNLQWRNRTGPCTFRRASQWSSVFKSRGFEIVAQRKLSRWRNLTHPVGRRLYVLKISSPGPSRGT